MRKRKIILSLCLALILSLSSLVLFGCGKKTSISKTYKLFDTTMTSMKASDLFKENTQANTISTNSDIINFKTKFQLKDFFVGKSGNSHYEKDELAYNQYVILLAEGLNFIDDYYPLLKDVKIKQNYEELDNSIKSVNKSFGKTNTAHNNLPVFANQSITLEGQSVPLLVYNQGYFAAYRDEAAGLIDKVYSCAFKLSDFLINEVKYIKNIGKEKMTVPALQFYFDYEVLSLYDDFRLLFMKSFEGRNIQPINGDALYAKSNLAKLSLITDKTVNSSVNFEKAAELKSFIKNLDGTRKDVRKAVKNFSYYRLAQLDYQIEPMVKEDENAQTYYNLLESYFPVRTSSTTSFINYIIGYLDDYCA